MNNKDIERLEQLFLHGTLPKNLEGFYKGSLEKFIPGTFIESVADLILKFWLPWYGKDINGHNKQGSNILSSRLTPAINLLFGSNSILKKDRDRIYAFPFKIRESESLNDKIKVIQLDYNLPANPPLVRAVIDELVCTSKNDYLGKAFLKKGGRLRLVAFFKLEK